MLKDCSAIRALVFASSTFCHICPQHPQPSRTTVVIQGNPLFRRHQTPSVTASWRTSRFFLGSTNVFIQPMSFDFLHYFSGPWVQQQPASGGDMRSMITSGRIRYSDWRRCYNVFVIDLERVSDSITDELIKNIQISFQNDTQLTYNFVLITEYQEEVTMDCITGQVVASDGQQ